MEIVISNGNEPHNSLMALRTKTVLHQRRRNSASRMKHHLPHEFLVGQTALHSSGSSALTITSANSSKCNKILHMNIYIYIYICIHTHTHTHTHIIYFVSLEKPDALPYLNINETEVLPNLLSLSLFLV